MLLLFNTQKRWQFVKPLCFFCNKNQPCRFFEYFFIQLYSLFYSGIAKNEYQGLKIQPIVKICIKR